MAYLDPRIWCHPKLADLSDKAFRTYINGIAYSDGFDLHGHLTPGHQATIGTTPKARTELVTAGLWEPNGNGVYIHNYRERNDKREERRARARERVRQGRAEGRYE